MKKYRLPKRLIRKSRKSTGGRQTDGEGVPEWRQSAEQVEELLRWIESADKKFRSRSSNTSRKRKRSPNKPTLDIKINYVDEISPGISPLEKRADLPSHQSKPQDSSRQSLVLGNCSLPSEDTRAANGTLIPGQSQPNSSGPSSEFSFQPYHYCGFCKAILQKSRAFRLRPPESTSTDVPFHLEGGGCSCCDSDNPYDRQVLDLFPYRHRTLGPVRKSARDGCHLCSLLVGRIGPYDEPVSDPQGDCYGVAVHGVQSYRGPGKILLEKRVSKEWGHRTLKTIELSYALWPKEPPASLQYTRTDSQPMYVMAKEWLRQCREEHDLCNSVATLSDFLPTRLIEITAAGDDVHSIKLCVTFDLANRDVPYLALSHRWGGRSTSLLSQNYNSFLNDIPISSLPQNFLDAVRITSNMGFSYLWIDSLCIIQDSPVDKVREIPSMSEIYGHAVLTIAALAADNSNGGCFTSRYPLSLVPALLRDGDSNKRDQIWAEPEKSRGPNADGDKRAPLHTRGWVVQERALAPRTLNFGADMVHWECVEAKADEASPEMVKDSESLSSRNHVGMGLKCALGIVRQDIKTGRGYSWWNQFWWRIVREYTASQLTYNSDKWNAIASLAKHAEQAFRQSPTPNRLFFGLWEHNLDEELMWRTSKPGKRIHPADFKAPTWSWLSVDAAVFEQRFGFERSHDRVATAQVDAEARLLSDGMAGSGRAIIRGCLFELTLRISRDEEGNRIYAFRSVRGQGRAFGKDEYAFKWWPDTHLDNSGGLAVLPIVRGKRDGDGCNGLVVRPSDPAKLSWERVGSFHLKPVGGKCAGSTRHFDGKWETIVLV